MKISQSIIRRHILSSSLCCSSAALSGSRTARGIVNASQYQETAKPAAINHPPDRQAGMITDAESVVFAMSEMYNVSLATDSEAKSASRIKQSDAFHPQTIEIVKLRTER